MSWHVAVRPEAAQDIELTALWYEAQRPELGQRFLDELDHVFSRLAESPRQFPEIDPGYRRALLRRFPYGIYFAVEDQRLVVLTVLHLHRHPDTWRGRK